MVEERLHFTGITAYPGVIYGKCKRFRPPETGVVIHKTDLLPGERISEEQIFLRTLDITENELRSIIQENQDKEGSFELREILSVQIDMLRDPMLVDGVRERIMILGENTGLAVENTIQRIYDDFLSLDDAYFRERSDHIQDIGKRITRILYTPSHAKPPKDTELTEPVILVAKDISPSEMAAFDKTKILGIATDQGGKTGHMAIIARNYGIPTIVGLKNLSTYIEDGEYILLDAERGFVKRNPHPEEYKLFGPRSQLTHRVIQKADTNLKTRDGERIHLKANLETDSGCQELLEKNAEGIGLYRSEVLFLQFKNHTPTEEEQFNVYRKILRKMENRPVTIRTFDIGADKYEVGAREDNPFLGNRGIRYLLRHPSLFKEQLRALIRASIYGDLKILLPMVTAVSEITRTKQLILECNRELRNEGQEILERIPLGIMVETPACAFRLDEYAKHADFLSVGTNDLLQYLMAVDRNNYSISDLYNPFHFVFLDVLEGIAQTAKKRKIPVSICGEAATDPNLTGLLIAMGYRELSVSPPFLIGIQERIQNIRIKDEKALLKKAKQLALEEKYFELETLIRKGVPSNESRDYS